MTIYADKTISMYVFNLIYWIFIAYTIEKQYKDELRI